MAQDNLKNIEKLKSTASNLPKTPGCYLFYNSTGEVLYVGKAKSLRQRVLSYFRSDHKDSVKTRYLVEKIREISFELTETDAEAFVLENILIKKYRPKYNIRLKDDKSYPYIILKKGESFPRIEFRRRVKKDKVNLCFGPFVHGSNLFNMLKVVNKAFRLRDCSDHEFNSRKEPCILYQMNQCSAPCVDLISEQDYQRDLNLGVSLFKGESKAPLKALNKEMLRFAEQEEFENAGRLRDLISEISEFSQNFIEIASKEGQRRDDVDLVGWYLSEHEVDISIGIIRSGVHFGHKSHYFLREDFERDYSFLEAITQFYVQYLISSSDALPRKVLFQIDENRSKECFSYLEKSVADIMHTKIDVLENVKKYESLLSLNKRQAEENYKIRKLENSSTLLALKKLQALLGLGEAPRFLECYDVAIFQGKSPTASQVTFVDGSPDKKNYRHYHLKELDEGNNDFAMMKEVASRRADNGRLPDVFIIDGGKGQVSAFKRGLSGAALNVPIIGIAKSKTKSSFKSKALASSEERLIIPGQKDSVILPKGSALFRVLTQMRDEAHRFSRRLHHHKESGKLIKSWLDEVPGVGEKTKNKILSIEGSNLVEIEKLSTEELMNKFGISIKVAKNILHFLKNKN